MLKFNTEEEALAWADRFAHKPGIKSHIKKSVSKQLIPSEAEEQRSLIYWCEVMKYQYPDLDLIFAVPNGDLRDKKTAALLSSEGVKSGVPDLILPVPRGTYHGLYIEMKRSDGGSGTSKNQDKWIERLQKHIYCVKVCWGFEKAKTVITWYYSLGEYHAD